MRLTTVVFLVFGAFNALSVPHAHAQDCMPTYTYTGEAANDGMGSSVSGAGDVDNDGTADVIVGTTYGNEAYVYSGQTGLLLYTFTGEAAGDMFGYSVSGAGDINNDGYSDLIVGAHYVGQSHAGRAYAYSGLTGMLLRTFSAEAGSDYFGASVSGAGDVDNDGYDDLIVGAPWNSAGGPGAGRAYVYSGQTGARLYTFTGEVAFDNFGEEVSGAGDVDNDGFADLIVGAYCNDEHGYRAGKAYVYSGLTGMLLWSFTGDKAGDFFGQAVASAGDVDNDGFADLIVGANGNDAGGNSAGRAYVYSGQTGARLYTFTGEAVGHRFGNSVSGAGDVDNDGTADVIVGTAYGNAAYVYSGQTGARLYTFPGEQAGDRFGSSVSGAGDIDNDGYADLVVGAVGNDAGGNDAGRAYVFSCGLPCSGFNGLFCDDFEDGDDAGWFHPSANCTWSVIDGQYTTSLSGSRIWCISSAGEVSRDNYIVGAFVKGTAGVDKVLLFRVQDESNFYAVNLRSDYPSPGIDEITVDKMYNGVYSADIVTVPYPSENGQWYHLKVSAVEDTFTVWVDDNLVAGWRDLSDPFYTGKVAVAGWTGDAGTATVYYDNIVVTNPPFLSVAPENLDFVAIQNGPLPGSQSVSITNIGGGLLDWSISDDQPWLDINPISGQSNEASVDVSVNSTTLSPGIHTGQLTVSGTSAGNGPVTVEISYTLTTLPHMEVNPDELRFLASQYGPTPATQMIEIRNLGGDLLDWSITSDVPWVDIVPSAGLSNYSQVAVTVNSTTMEPDLYSGQLTISSANADNSAQTVEMSYRLYNPDGTPAELDQYDQIRTRLENLEIDLFGPGLAIPTANYDLTGANNFVHNFIRPGYPTPEDLDAFYRLLMAMKLVNAGYRYVPDPFDHLPEEETIHGNEELVDLAVKNTIASVIAGVVVLKFIDNLIEGALGEKVAILVKGVIADASGLVMDAIAQITRFIPDEDTRRVFDQIFSTLKDILVRAITDSRCIACTLTEPATRVVVDEIGIGLFHVSQTQGIVDDAGLSASTHDMQGTLQDAEQEFADEWEALKFSTDNTIETVEYYEELADIQSLAADLQDLWDASMEGSYRSIWKAIEVVGRILGVQDSWNSGQAAQTALGDAMTLPWQISSGAHDIFWPFSPLPAASADATGTAPPVYSLVTQNSVSPPPELDQFEGRSQNLVDALHAGDSTAVAVAAESLSVSIDNVGSIFGDHLTQLISKMDSARAYYPEFDSIMAVADSVSSRASMRLLQSGFIVLGVTMHPYDTAFNAECSTVLADAVAELNATWSIIDGALQTFLTVPSSPTLVIRADPAQEIVPADSQLTVTCLVKNIGDAVASNAFASASATSVLSVFGPDSVGCGDLEAGDSTEVTFTVLIVSDSLLMDSSAYQTFLFDIAAYCSSGVAGHSTVALSVQTPCSCPCANSPVCDLIWNVQDIVSTIDVTFRGVPSIADPTCPRERTDVDCSGGTDIIDVVKMVNVVFQGADPAIEYCDPYAP